MRFIFVPIVQDLHWSMIILANMDSIIPWALALARSCHADIASPSRRPCIVHMDPLSDAHPREEIANALRQYLVDEFAAKKARTWDPACGVTSNEILDILRTLPVVAPDIPTQNNTWDCGLYSVKYTEDFFKIWPNISADDAANNRVPGFTNDMVTGDEIVRKRTNMLRAIEALIREREHRLQSAGDCGDTP